MEFNGIKFYGDHICVFSLFNKDFVSEQISYLENIMTCDNFWSGFNNTSIGNLLLVLKYSNITLEQKNTITKILSLIPENYLQKLAR